MQNLYKVVRYCLFGEYLKILKIQTQKCIKAAEYINQSEAVRPVLQCVQCIHTLKPRPTFIFVLIFCHITLCRCKSFCK